MQNLDFICPSDLGNLLSVCVSERDLGSQVCSWKKKIQKVCSWKKKIQKVREEGEMQSICYYGRTPETKTSGIDLNPERRFITCANNKFLIVIIYVYMNATDRYGSAVEEVEADGCFAIATVVNVDFCDADGVLQANSMEVDSDRALQPDWMEVDFCDADGVLQANSMEVDADRALQPDWMEATSVCQLEHSMLEIGIEMDVDMQNWGF
ncbi:unnamed protein product [Ilex paraguariensis]|uniref:Uncharacterized protein n=1 Tax=Ilex paraguariensis TaxID=185542 RepID=A0ABC8TF87_9AQUA